MTLIGPATAAQTQKQICTRKQQAVNKGANMCIISPLYRVLGNCSKHERACGLNGYFKCIKLICFDRVAIFCMENFRRLQIAMVDEPALFDELTDIVATKKNKKKNHIHKHKCSTCCTLHVHVLGTHISSYSSIIACLPFSPPFLRCASPAIHTHTHVLFSFQ